MKRRQLPPGVYYEPKSGRYVAKQRLGGKLTRAVTFDTAADAAEHNAAVRAAYLAEATPVRSKGVSVGAWLDDWLVRRQESGRYRDVPHDRAVLRRYVGEDVRSIPLRELRSRNVRSWLYDLAGRDAHVGGKAGEGERKTKGRKLSRQTVANALNLLRASLADAVDAGKISSNPAAGLRPPRDAATSREHTGYLSSEQIEALLELDLSTEIWSVYVVAIYTGLRAGELWGLRWEDVVLDGDRPELVVRRSYSGPTKGGRVRRVPLLAPAREALRTWRASLAVTPIAGLVWPAVPDKDGNERTRSRGYDAEWRRWAPRAGIDMPLKQARHTCGCHLVIGTWGPPLPLEAVQAWLGHQSITTTERFYARYQPARLHSYREAIDGSEKSSDDQGRRKAKAPEPS